MNIVSVQLKTLKKKTNKKKKKKKKKKKNLCESRVITLNSNLTSGTVFTKEVEWLGNRF